MMQIHVKMIGIFGLLLNDRKLISIDVKKGTTVIEGIREAADFGKAELRRALLDERGELNPEIVVLLNSGSIFPSKFDQTILNNDDILTLIPMVAGG